MTIFGGVCSSKIEYCTRKIPKSVVVRSLYTCNMVSYKFLDFSNNSNKHNKFSAKFVSAKANLALVSNTGFLTPVAKFYI